MKKVYAAHNHLLNYYDTELCEGPSSVKCFRFVFCNFAAAKTHLFHFYSLLDAKLNNIIFIIFSHELLLPIHDICYSLKFLVKGFSEGMCIGKCFISVSYNFIANILHLLQCDNHCDANSSLFVVESFV